MCARGCHDLSTAHKRAWCQACWPGVRWVCMQSWSIYAKGPRPCLPLPPTPCMHVPCTRHAALVCGAYVEVDDAQRRLHHRRQRAARDLVRACHALCRAAAQPAPCSRPSGACAGVGGGRASEGDRRGCLPGGSGSDGTGHSLISTYPPPSQAPCLPAPSSSRAPPPIVLYPPGGPLLQPGRSSSHYCNDSGGWSEAGSANGRALSQLLRFVQGLEAHTGLGGSEGSGSGLLATLDPPSPASQPVVTLNHQPSAGPTALTDNDGEAHSSNSNGGASTRARRSRRGGSRAGRLAAAAAEALPPQPPPQLLALLPAPDWGPAPVAPEGGGSGGSGGGSSSGGKDGGGGAHSEAALAAQACALHQGGVVCCLCFM